MPDTHKRLVEIVPRCGIGYRQAHHWVAQGYVHAEYRDHDGNVTDPGSGRICFLSADEASVLAVMARLVLVGWHPWKAGELARNLVESGQDSIDAGFGVRVSLTTTPLPAEGPVKLCGALFPGQALRCREPDSHEDWHRSGSVRWNDGGDWDRA